MPYPLALFYNSPMPDGSQSQEKKERRQYPEINVIGRIIGKRDKDPNKFYGFPLGVHIPNNCTKIRVDGTSLEFIGSYSLANGIGFVPVKPATENEHVISLEGIQGQSGLTDFSCIVTRDGRVFADPYLLKEQGAVKPLNRHDFIDLVKDMEFFKAFVDKPNATP